MNKGKNNYFINPKKKQVKIFLTLIITMVFLMGTILPLINLAQTTSGKSLVSDKSVSSNSELRDAIFSIFGLPPINLVSSATIWTTDIYGNPKTDFAPGELVYIHGSGFLGNHNVDIDITRPDSTVNSDSTMTDSGGNFVYVYDLNGIIGSYDVLASDGVNSATTTFTDAVHVDFSQYANLAPTYEKWIGSILQASNSVYYEGMSVPQRAAFVDIGATTGDVHTLTLSHQATKGGIHAYDWLTAWNQGNVPPLNYIPWGDDIGPHVTTAICQSLHQQTGSNEIFVDVPDDPFISKDDTPPTPTTQTRIDAYELAEGNRQIRICGNLPITSASFTSMSHDVANGADTGDSFIDYELTWVSASDQILIELAGHLAVSGDPSVNPIAWGIGLGSADISGGPYHFKLDELDGHALGSQDNQIKGADIIIPDGCLEVTKVVDWGGSIPDPGQTFTVTVTGPSHPSPGTTHVFGSSGGTWTLNDLTPGDYTVTETDPGLSWVVTPSYTQTVTVDSGTPCATVSITNTLYPGCLEINKYVDWAGNTPDPSQTFTVTVTGPSHPGGISHVFGYNGGWWTLYDLIPGVYTVTETDPGSPWMVTPGLTQTVTVEPTTMCAYASITNFYYAGCLEITKIVEWFGVTPDPGQTFTVTVTGPSYPGGIPHVFGHLGGTWTLNDLAPGSYTVTETDPGPNWIVSPGLTQTVTVSVGTPCASVSITNYFDAGCLDIEKHVEWGGSTPDPGQTFTVTVTGPSHPSPGITYVFDYYGGWWDLNNLIPGVYTVTETDPGPNWIVTPSLTQTVTVYPGLSCTYVYISNTYNPGCLEITKIVDWNGHTPDPGQTFTVTVTGPSHPGGTIHAFGSTGGTWTLNDLIPGSYTVVETDPGPNWVVTPGLSQTVTVDPGTPCATVSITNTFMDGCLEITKIVDWNGHTPDPGQTFTVTVTGPSYPGGITHVFGHLGGMWTLMDLIPGSYTVVETDPGPNWVVTPGLSQSVTVDPGTPCATVSITNTFIDGCLEVTKIVDWNGHTPDPGQTFTVTVTGPSHPSPGKSTVFPELGGTWTEYNLIPGVYTVTETDPGPKWLVTPGLSQTVTVDPGMPCATVSITNTYTVGCLEVTKIVDWQGSTPDPGQTFTVTVTGPSYPSPGKSTVFPELGGTWTEYNLIPGVYTVTETDPGPKWLVTPGLSQTVTVDPGTPCATVSITNTYQLGCLEVTKIVDWQGSTPDPGQTFTVTVTGPSHPSPGISHVFGPSGGTWTIMDLIQGSYTITETDPGSQWTVSGSPQTVTVDPGTPCASVSITNTFKLGCLEVTKIVDWGSVTPDPAQIFTVTVTGPSHPSPGISHVFGPSGGTWTIMDLIPGSYTITETDPGTNWFVTPSLTQTVTVDPGTPCASVVIMNRHGIPCIEVDKQVKDPDSGLWVEELLGVPNHAVLKFKITIINCGEIPLTNIVVTDTMADPQLQYNNNAIPTEDSVSPDLRTVIWNIALIAVGDSFVITFDAKAVDMCFGWNNVYVSSDQGESDDDLVPVKVIYGDPPQIDINKLVWDNFADEWVKVIYENIGTVLTFKIVVTNSVSITLHDVIVTDYLPDHLIYIDTISVDGTIVSELPHQVIWTLGDILPDESKEITFTASINSEGLDDNVASVTAMEPYTSADSVLVVGVDWPIIKLLYPQGGETLSGTATVKWFATDSSDPNLDIYLYYSTNGLIWSQLNGVLHNDKVDGGEYNWDTTMLSDGEYILKVEAINYVNALSVDDSEPFIIDNGYSGIKVSTVQITDMSTNSDKWVKDGDTVKITAGITGSYSLNREDIVADLSSLGRGSQVIANSYDGFTATWTLANVVCTPADGIITVTVTADEADTNSATITADNTAPKMTIDKPVNGLYFMNRKFLPLARPIIIGPITVETNIEDKSDVNKVEFYVDNELKETLSTTPFDWYMNLKLMGRYNLEIIVYDHAENKQVQSIDMQVFNLFGRN